MGYINFDPQHYKQSGFSITPEKIAKLAPGD